MQESNSEQELGSTTNITTLFGIYSSVNRASFLHNCIACFTFVAIALFVLSTNFVVIVGISRRRIWRLPSLRFFVLLMVTDLLVGLLTLPVHVAVYAKPTLLLEGGSSTVTSSSSNLLISLIRFSSTFPIILSMITVFLITLDRFFAIVKTPVHKQYATNRFIFLVITVSVFLALAWGVLTMTVFPRSKVAKFTSLVTLGALKTTLFISVCWLYSVVMKTVQRTATTTRVSFVSSQVTSPTIYDRAFSRLSLVICGTFMLCHLPSIAAHFYIAAKVFSSDNINNNNNKHSNNTGEYSIQIRNMSSVVSITATKDQNLLCFYLVTWCNVPMFLNSGINGVLLVYGNRKLKRWFLNVCGGIVTEMRSIAILPVFGGGGEHAVSPRQRKNAIVGDVVERRIVERVAINFRIDAVT